MATYKLTIEYEGTRFSGWQAQGNTHKTVQGHLIAAASQVLGKVEIGGAGRTDAGVHAAMQVAHLRTHRGVDPVALQRKVNDLLPHDIHVVAVERAGDAFHARHDAISRVYLYQIATRRSAFAKPFVWWIKDRLDAGAISEAASRLAGRHDFSAFTDKRLPAAESRIVVVERCEVGVAGDLILVRIAASHFLWKMVRKTVALLVDVGRGAVPAERITELLKNRGPAVEQTAPPSGLFLESIVYPGESFDRPLGPIVPVSTIRNARSDGTRVKRGRR